MGTSSCGGRVEVREGKEKAQIRRLAAFPLRRGYPGPPFPSAQKLLVANAGTITPGTSAPKCPKAVVPVAREDTISVFLVIL